MKRALGLIRLVPGGWPVVALAGAAVFALASITTPTFLGFTFDPFGLEARKLAAETRRADREASNGVARGLEVEGEREQAARVDTFHRQVVEIHTITAEAVSQARSAPDANEPLPADRLDRLRANDRQLCALSPASCAGRVAEAGDADGG